MIRKETVVGEEVFIRGGKHDGGRIPIKHACRSPTSGAYNVWKKNDRYLDWDAFPESHQGIYKDIHYFNKTLVPKGTPTWWSTNDLTSDAYHYANNYGDHYWVVELLMDCTEHSILDKDQQGQTWFELKALFGNRRNWSHYYIGQYAGSVHTWEMLPASQGECGGNVGGQHPFGSIYNHAARCGKLNIFNFGDNSCVIHDIPPRPDWYPCL